MTPALSELSVTEFVAPARLGLFPRGLVVGSCVYSAGTQYDWTAATREVTKLKPGDARSATPRGGKNARSGREAWR